MDLHEPNAIRLLDRLDPHRTDLQFRRMSDRIITTAGQEIDGYVVEAERCEDCPARGSVRRFDPDLYRASRARQLGKASILETPGIHVMRIHLESLFRQQVVDAARPTGLSARVVRRQAPTRREPDRILVVDRLRRGIPADRRPQRRPPVSRRPGWRCTTPTSAVA